MDLVAAALREQKKERRREINQTFVKLLSHLCTPTTRDDGVGAVDERIARIDVCVVAVLAVGWGDRIADEGVDDEARGQARARGVCEDDDVERFSRWRRHLGVRQARVSGIIRCVYADAGACGAGRDGGGREATV